MSFTRTLPAEFTCEHVFTWGEHHRFTREAVQIALNFALCVQFPEDDDIYCGYEDPEFFAEYRRITHDNKPFLLAMQMLSQYADHQVEWLTAISMDPGWADVIFPTEDAEPAPVPELLPAGLNVQDGVFSYEPPKF